MPHIARACPEAAVLAWVWHLHGWGWPSGLDAWQACGPPHHACGARSVGRTDPRFCHPPTLSASATHGASALAQRWRSMLQADKCSAASKLALIVQPCRFSSTHVRVTCCPTAVHLQHYMAKVKCAEPKTRHTQPSGRPLTGDPAAGSQRACCGSAAWATGRAETSSQRCCAWTRSSCSCCFLSGSPGAPQSSESGAQPHACHVQGTAAACDGDFGHKSPEEGILTRLWSLSEASEPSHST